MKAYLTLTLALPLFLHAPFAHAQIITTIAGGGLDTSAIYIGDGGPATAGVLSNPYATAVDAAGNVYIADFNNHRIRKVNTSGIITTIAGNGNISYNGDGIMATAAQINSPGGVAVDNNGNVYISDGNYRIRKVDSSGIITTFAGTGVPGYSGDNGPATAARLYGPCGLAYDHGNLYICDASNYRLRKVDASGIITTIAGSGTNMGYSGDGGTATATDIGEPYGVAIDTAGNIFFSDWSYNRVCKVNTSGVINTIAGGNPAYCFSGDNGPATAADFHIPIGVAVDHYGNIYIGDSYNNRVRIVNSSGIITTYAGTGVAGYSGDNGLAISAEIYGPVGITTNSVGDLYIAEYANSRIRYVTNTVFVNAVDKAAQQINVYPNPNKGVFIVDIISAINEQILVTITNMTGEKIKEIYTVTNQPVEITIDAPAGIYSVIVATTHEKWSKKILLL